VPEICVAKTVAIALVIGRAAVEALEFQGHRGILWAV
jgi:hypothetical protein